MSQVVRIVAVAIALTGLGPVAKADHTSAANAVTLWWVIFNNPEHCTTSPCDEPDLFNVDVNASIAYGTGQISRRNGRVALTAALYETGDGFHDVDPFTTSLVGGPGLVDSKAAEIHLVVRDHGQPVQGMVDQQLSEFIDPGCLELGGPNVCADVQYAVFGPQQDGPAKMFRFSDFGEVYGAEAKLIRLDGAVKAMIRTNVRK